MLSSEDVIKLIEAQGSEITAKIIFDLIKDHEKQAGEMKRFYNRYAGDVPIKNRAKIDKAGISLNNKLANDYDGLIIDEIVGYVWGHAIKINYEDPDEARKKAIESQVALICTENNMDAVDEESGEYSCACGYASRLLYYDTEGILKIMNTLPWETIFVLNNSTNETDYAIIYYPWEIVDVKTGRVTKTTKVEWYDKDNVTYYIKDGGKYVLEKSDDPEYKNPQIHNFDYVPVIKIKANNLEQSDLYKVESLIDAYNELSSDAQNEVQEFVHAYLKATGAQMDEEERKKARRTRVFNLPDKDSDVDFITKNINAEFFNSHKKDINDDIFRFSKTVDMNDEKFSAGGAESGEARKWKLLALEFKAIKKERKFAEALRYQWKVIASALRKKGIDIDYLQLNFIFIRSLPIDFLYYADIAGRLRGILPMLDILSLMPFVKDPQEVLKRLTEESAFDLDNLPSDEELEDRVKKLIASSNNGA